MYIFNYCYHKIEAPSTEKANTSMAEVYLCVPPDVMPNGATEMSLTNKTWKRDVYMKVSGHFNNSIVFQQT
jgi:hypothetical protein